MSIPASRCVEIGPLCTPLGHYGRPRPAPVMHVTALTHRANPVYWAMLPGPPPNESGVIARAMAGIFLPLVKRTHPGVGRLRLAAVRRRAALGRAGDPQELRRPGPPRGRHGLGPAAVAVRQVPGRGRCGDRRPRPRGRCLRPWPPTSTRAATWSSQEGPPDPLDAATPAGSLSARLAIDATAKLPDEVRRPQPSEPARMSEAIRQLVADRWPEYGLGRHRYPLVHKEVLPVTPLAKPRENGRTKGSNRSEITWDCPFETRTVA